MNCSHGTTFGPAIREGEPDSTAYLRVDCHRWKCPRCGPQNAKRYKKAIIRAASGEAYKSGQQGRKLQRFITLTLDPKKMPEGYDSLKYLRECFNKFRVYLGRKFGHSITFIAVIEFQKNGNAHLHGLIADTISQEWIIDTWQACGGGFQCKIKFVDVHRVSRYLSKYLTKEMLTDVPEKKKRVSTSRDLLLFPPSDWSYSRHSIARILQSISLSDTDDMRFDDEGLFYFLLRKHDSTGPPCREQQLRAIYETRAGQLLGVENHPGPLFAAAFLGVES